MNPPGNQKKPPRDPNSVKTMLSTIALALGVGVIGAYALDLHSHTCEACGNKWRHLGVFNLGDPGPHTCVHCGTVQWWKDGMPHVFRTALREPAPHVLPGSSVSRWIGMGHRETPGLPSPLTVLPAVRRVGR